MILKSYPDLILGDPKSDVYLFTVAARNDEGAPEPQLSIEQIEAARNAAAAVLKLLGVEVETTSSVFPIDVAPNEEPCARLIIRATLEDNEVETSVESVEETLETTVEESAPTIPGADETPESDGDEIELVEEPTDDETASEGDEAAGA